MIDIPRSNHNDVVPDIVGVMVFFNHLLTDCLHVAKIAQNREADLLIFEDAAMSDLNCRLEWL